MSTISSSSTQPKDQPMAQRRRSSFGQGSPSPPSPHQQPGGVGGRVSTGGRDVTTTSPSGGVSVHALPPALYQPPPGPLLERKSSTMATNRSSFSEVPLASTASVAGESSSSSTITTTSSGGTSSKSSMTGKVKENTGRWQAEEHEVFLKGLNEHGKQWKKIAMMIKTRSVVQVRTHAQKYFQKLLKNEKKEDGRSGKDRSSSIISTSTATSVAQTGGPVKRKSTTKGNKTTSATAAAFKKRRVSLEPKPTTTKKNQPSPRTGIAHSAELSPVPVHHVHHHYSQHQQAPPPPPQPLMATAPPMPVPPPATVSPTLDHNVIDPSFMNTLNMASGELDDSLLDLLDDSSVEAVEQVIGGSDDMDSMDLEPNRVETEPTSVSPSVSSMSLVDSVGNPVGAVINPTPAAEVMAKARHEIVTSPNPEDYSVHNNTIVASERSPTSVACMMDMKDFEQKTSNYVDALDWLMDVGVHQLPATASEQEEDWANSSLAVPVVPKLSVSKLAQVNSSALSVLDGDVF